MYGCHETVAGPIHPFLFGPSLDFHPHEQGFQYGREDVCNRRIRIGTNKANQSNGVFNVLLSIILAISAYSMFELPVPAQDDTCCVDHTLFEQVLQQYVDGQGGVDYAGLKKSNALQPYLDQLELVYPDSLEAAEAVSFWINAYNAYTLKLIVDNYPVRSIREITPLRLKGLSLAIPKINSPFEYKLARIGGKTYSLDDIEHGILRKQFDEPRIHFALVCASTSCPKLRKEAFKAEVLDQQLQDQAVDFLTNTDKNVVKLENEILYLSKIFRWFKKDFTRSHAHLQAYLAPFFEGELSEKLAAGAFKVRYRAYDWSLNEQV